jgi:hypothetical protein
MNELYTTFSKLAFVLLAVWVVLAGLGLTDAPWKKAVSQVKRKVETGNARGQVWAVPVTQAPMVEDGLAYPAGMVF